MDILAKLVLMRDLPIGSMLPPEIAGDDGNWAVSLKRLFGEAVEEIEGLRRQAGCLPPKRLVDLVGEYDDVVASQDAMDGLS